ncbi:PREDICTED: uncharacterized protein LOC104744497 [Camelina sativa]|uniref:Uncharacterized protein LOC104744497 n=1 Tax=Camelina sativa TaxID=90675 RepID=A0ABM0W068_CAMSA|nr:PREDICTED: uncharacterized protein LOC104744497 [Camelina sativa]
MQSLRSVFAKVYRGGRSMGSHQARNFFSSPSGVYSASNVAARILIRGISAAVVYAIAPHISGDLKREKQRNEILRDLDEFYEESEKYWSDMLDRRNLKASRKRQ